MSAIQETRLGTIEGKPISQYTMTNSLGMKARVINYGAIITELHVPDREGKSVDVVLGFDTLENYLGRHPHFGATVGRVANRIGGGTFTLDGRTYALTPNEGPNHIHGGLKGFDKKIWDVSRAGQGLGDVFIRLVLSSPDGDQGYPGHLKVSVFYTLTHDNILRIEMEASTDAPTIINLANHSYFNLAGHGAGQVLDHIMTLHADRYTPTDAARIPIGELAKVAGTPFDFTSPKPIGAHIREIPKLSPDDPGGYDHNFVINGEAGSLRQAACGTEPKSGRIMEVYTDQPGVQFYTGNFLDGTIKGKHGAVYQKHAGFCLETQGFPDAINQEGTPGWPSVILRPGEKYRHVVEYRFTTA